MSSPNLVPRAFSLVKALGTRCWSSTFFYLPRGGKMRDVAVEIDDPTFRAFIHLIHVTGPLRGLFFKQLLNYKPVELDFALHKVRSIFIASTGT